MCAFLTLKKLKLRLYKLLDTSVILFETKNYSFVVSQMVRLWLSTRLVDVNTKIRTQDLLATSLGPLPQDQHVRYFLILMPVSEHGYFIASSWRTPLRHPPPKLLLTNWFYFQQTSGIHAPVGTRKGCSLSSRSPAPVADSFNVATMARKQRVKFTRNWEK
jgi:hypothetical protein